MKRIFACFLLSFMMLTVLSGCVYSEYSPVPGGKSASDSSYAPESLKEQLQNIRIDGSASTVPLETGIRAALLGISQGEAEKQVSRTNESFHNLIDNKCDIILTDNSRQQSDYASSKGFECETFKIASEGLVFIVNKNNPIETLTQQQIKDIYSGKITNWKDVGGSDTEIAAFQHKPASVSQNYMTAFMGDTPLMKAKTVTLPEALTGLEGAVASYDNGINSIGYCVYSYAAEMYAGANNVKFIKIDGIQPSKDTMSDGSYPLISYSYAVINKNTPEDSPIRALIDWILSAPGQKAVADSGYIPVSNLNTLEQTILNTRGTGPEKPADFKMPSTYYSAFPYLKYDEKKGDKGTEYYNYRIEGLKNKSLQNEINSFIKQAETNANDQRSEVEAYAKSCFESAHLHSLHVESLCSNGYLYVVVSNTYDEGTDISPNYYYKPVTAVWDLYTGKRLNFSDLFWKDEDFLPAVNTEIRERLNIPYDILGDTYELKRDFWALPETFSTFTWNHVYFASREGVFTHGIRVEFAARHREMLVTGQLRDMKDIWEDTVSVNKEYYVYSCSDFGIFEKYGAENDVFNGLWLLDADKLGMDKAAAAAVNEYMKKQVEDNLTRKALDTRFGKGNYIDEIPANVTFSVYGNDYIIYNGEIYYDKLNREGYYTVDVSAIFDFKTGKRLSFDDVFSQGWKDEIQWLDNKDHNINDFTLAKFWINSYDNVILIVGYNKKASESVEMHIPDKYLIHYSD